MDAPLDRGRRALAVGAWEEARAAFGESLRGTETPEALEGLGLAAWWLDLADVMFDARERAYRLFLARDDRAAAARIATSIAWDHWAFRGEHAVANGWLHRARRLLDGLPDAPERAWLESREASLALLEDGDPDRAFAHAAEGIRAAREARNVDLEMLNRALQGLALVSSGAVAEGMRLLDEVNAAVIAGELTDLVTIGLACCYLIAACDRVRDYDRALQWCSRLKEFCARWGLRPLFAVCRMQYASICMWRGTWLEAEQELVAATEELAASRPAMTADGRVRLAELRRRQGRLVEALEMFDKSEPHPLASLGKGELALGRGDAPAACDFAERYLRRIPLHNRLDRSLGLDLLIRALVRGQDLDRARTALAEMNGIARLVGTAAARASASAAAGAIAHAAGDYQAARRSLEDAVDGFIRAGASFDLARARLDLARTLQALGRSAAAIEEARRAMDLFADLKADGELPHAQALWEELRATGAAARVSTSPAGGLTRRELEVLRLVASGLHNDAIAAQLCVSEHTVHRHISNILGKLSVSSRAAAVAQAARKGLLA